jgi:aubergine-like protein
VDFVPEVDATLLKKNIISSNESALNLGRRYVFDGSSLYTQAAVNLEVDGEFNGRSFKITLRQTGVVDENDENGLYQTFNLILRTAMGKLRLQNIKRDYFDAKAKIQIPDHKLELWPGYQTSVRQYDAGTLLNVEIIHKFMRNETVYDIAKRMMRGEERTNWQESLRREVLGTTILTDYTNKTYTVDDIAFNMNPNSTFKLANGDQTTYAAYYESKYNINIQDRQQFLLISRARERDIRAGHPEMIYLIPELSRATGMTDQMRQNFRLMKEVSEFTRVNPERRVQSLNQFNRRVQDTQESARVFDDWSVELSKELVDVNIRELPTESILFGGERSEASNAKSEWSIRGSTSMYKTIDCRRWIYLYPKKIERESLNFLKTLIDAAKEMNYTIADPMQ